MAILSAIRNNVLSKEIFNYASKVYVRVVHDNHPVFKAI